MRGTWASVIRAQPIRCLHKSSADLEPAGLRPLPLHLHDGRFPGLHAGMFFRHDCTCAMTMHISLKTWCSMRREIVPIFRAATCCAMPGGETILVLPQPI